VGRIGNLVGLRLRAAVLAIVALGALSVTMPVVSASAPLEQECAPQDERGERPMLAALFAAVDESAAGSLRSCEVVGASSISRPRVDLQLSFRVVAPTSALDDVVGAA